MSNFVHLHVHSHYSLLDGLSKLPDLAKKAKEYGMSALALTDHGNMYGAIDFYMACQKEGIKPIIGVEAYVANRTRFDKEANLDNKRYHLTLLAKNMTGYKNLLKLVSASYLEGYYYKPRMDRDILREHHEGIITLSGCMGGELAKSLWNKNYAEAEKVARDYQEIFGEENYYLEIMHHPKLERGLELKEETIKLARKLNIPLVATQDSHYISPDDNKAQDTLLAIQTGNFEEGNKMGNVNEDFSFISTETAAKYFKDTPDALENTVKIAEQCELELTLGKFVFPNFPIPEGETGDSMLRKLTFAGLEMRGVATKPEYTARLEHELGVIQMKGYSSYFLVVEDLIRYARENNIYYNIRGSVAGSLTTYSLDITKVDPIAYKIPFERFLNPERPSAPDIDMDFADNRRDEIIEYAKRKYGADKVAQIGTFGTMMARGSVRDVARALGHPYSLGDTISKLIPIGSQGFPMTIDHAIETTPELREFVEKNSDAKNIIEMAKKIEGNARHISVHAAGVVISPEPLTNYTPLQYDPKGESIITQYDMYTVGEDGVGLTKFDFLGLRNLSILASAIELIETIYDKKIDIDTIPMDDPKTFAMLARGETEGLFQLNGTGMTRWLKELKPTTIHDINAMVALYRPGPMQFIPDYISHKHDPRLTTYLDPALKPILEESYGVLVYQDQLLMMAHDLAGYSWGAVDKFRKAVGKKIPALMAEQREKFVHGCMEHSGWSEKKATEVWAWLEPFAAYGFNKAHSASYGRVAYQTSYLKANYPTEYMTAVLSAESGDMDTITAVIAECKRMNIPVLGPDVNESFGDFAAVKDPNTPGLSEKAKKIAAAQAPRPDGILTPGVGASLTPGVSSSLGDRIRFGLYTIKNLGTEISNAIVAERKAGGRFTSIANFLERVKHKNLNKKSLEALIRAGALDGLGAERGKLLLNLENLLAYHQNIVKGGENQNSLFGLMSDQSSVPQLKLKDCEPATQKEKLAWEKELLGLYVSGHPLDVHRDKFAKNENTIKKIKESPDGMTVVAGGLLEEVKTILTKKGDTMAFGRLADYTGSIELVFFSKLYADQKAVIQPDACVAVKGKMSFRNNEASIVVDAIKGL